VKAGRSPRKLTHLGHARGWAAVAFGTASLDLTTARAEGAEVNTVQESSASATVPDGTLDAGPHWQAAAQSLRKQFDPREHRVVTSVSCEDVLCQILRLPATESSELKQMLDLQIDNITPLPLEDVVYSFEALDSAEGQTRVLVAIARKATVNLRVEALETAGLQPEIVSVDALAMFRALSKRSLLPGDNKLNVLVILGRGSANVIVYTQGLPMAVRSIVLGAEAEPVLREELQRTLVAAEAGQTQRACGGVTFLVQGEEMKAFAENVASGLSAPVAFLTNGAVPSAGLSLCLQFTEDKGAPLNLLPDEWRQKRETAALRQRLIRGAIAVGVVYAIALAVFLSLLAVKRAHLHRIDNEVRSQQPEFLKARGLQSELIAMGRQLDTKSSALEVLRDVSMRLPDNVKLNYFQYKKDQSVTLKAQAPSANMGLDFQSRLEKSDLFSKVTPGTSRTEAGGLTKFDLTCTLKTAAGIGTAP
jgi:type II secretory pathway component PulL